MTDNQHETMSDDDTDIEQLEEQLSRQQEIIEAMGAQLRELADVLPEHRRRRILKAGGAAGLLAIGAAGHAAAAPGDSGETVWGSSSNRDSYYAEEIDANSITTDALDSRQGYVDETANRTFDTEYQNNTGADLDVSVVAESSSSGTRVVMVMEVGEVSGSLTTTDKAYITLGASDRIGVQATVPDGYYYQVQRGGDTGSYSLDTWAEQA